jgi:ABC-type phosphate/phosphonate transport system substrate-binding protein
MTMKSPRERRPRVSDEPLISRFRRALTRCLPAPACRHVALALLLPALFLCGLPARAAAERDDDKLKEFRSGFLQSVFSNTDPRDAKAVLEVHSREISRELGLNITGKVVMFTTMASMADALRNGRLELASIPGIEYLRIRDTLPLIPSFVGTNSKGQGIRYVIITRKDSGIRSLADLKGKAMVLPLGTVHEPSHLWLDVLLLRAGHVGHDSFFREVRESPKASAAIMGVFFRQADAAIVTRTGLDTSRLLNPQLETQLTILAESPELNDFVVCMTPGTSEKFRSDIYRALLRLNESKSGRQLYTIFQTKGITPFKPAYLVELETLLREYNTLKAKAAKRR